MKNRFNEQNDRKAHRKIIAEEVEITSIPLHRSRRPLGTEKYSWCGAGRCTDILPYQSTGKRKREKERKRERQRENEKERERG